MALRIESAIVGGHLLVRATASTKSVSSASLILRETPLAGNNIRI